MPPARSAACSMTRWRQPCTGGAPPGGVVTNGVTRVAGLITPGYVTIPAELEAGIAVQLGERQLNPPFVDVKEAKAEVGRTVGRRIVQRRRPATLQHGGQVFGVPVQGHGQRFKGLRVASSLDLVLLDLADDRLGHLRPLGQLALSHTELVNPLIDRSRDRSPVVRHPFLRAPPRR